MSTNLNIDFSKLNNMMPNNTGSYKIETLNPTPLAIASLLALAACGGDGSNSSSLIAPINPSVASSAQPAANPLRIVTGTAYPAADAGLNPRWVIEDFNIDGIKDIFLRYDPAAAFSDTKTGTSSAHFFIGNASGGFVNATSSILPSGYSPTLVNRIIVSDFNADNRPDIFVATSGQDPYKNDKPLGTGQTGERSQILTHSSNGYVLSDMGKIPTVFAHHSSAGDINNDGVTDILVASVLLGDSFFVMGSRQGNYTIDTSRIDPGSTFTYLSNISSRFDDGFPKTWQSTIYSASAIVDANNDGYLDVVMFASSGTKSNIVFFNDKTGHFGKSNSSSFDNGVDSYNYLTAPNWNNPYSKGTNYLDTKVIDLNGDGKKDIIALATFNDQSPNNYVYYRGATLEFWINTGNGFTNETVTRSTFKYDPGQNFTHYDTLEVADINCDGFADILIHRGQFNRDTEANPTKILLNNGQGAFKEVQYPVNLPKGILTVLGPGHYAILINDRDPITETFTQRIDDVYFDWKSGIDFFTGQQVSKVAQNDITDYSNALAAANVLSDTWAVQVNYLTFA